MIHKLIVTRLSRNTARMQAIDTDGKPLMEKVFVQKQEIAKQPVLGDDEKPLHSTGGDPIYNDVIINRYEEEERAVIPDFFPDHEFYVFQETDESGSAHLRYFLEDGSAFEFHDRDDVRFESKILERNIKL